MVDLRKNNGAKPNYEEFWNVVVEYIEEKTTEDDRRHSSYTSTCTPVSTSFAFPENTTALAKIGPPTNTDFLRSNSYQASTTFLESIDAPTHIIDVKSTSATTTANSGASVKNDTLVNTVTPANTEIFKTIKFLVKRVAPPSRYETGESENRKEGELVVNMALTLSFSYMYRK